MSIIFFTENLVDQAIIDFDKWDPETLKENINAAFLKLGYDKESFLFNMLEDAARLECYNVCIVVRDLLKTLDK